MKVIEQSYEILSCPDNILEMIELAGRTCYKSEGKIGCAAPVGKDRLPQTDYCPDKAYEIQNCIGSECPHHSSHKFFKMLRDRGHHAMIEFGDIIVRFITNRGVTHEIVRHRLSSFAQESTRYVRYDGGMEFIRPVWCPAEILGEWNKISLIDEMEQRGMPHTPENRPVYTWIRAMANAEDEYIDLLNLGWRAEQAREVLPNSLKTEIVWKANIREWRHIFSLRTSKAAHPQMRALMTPLLKELKQRLPVVFDDL